MDETITKEQLKAATDKAFKDGMKANQDRVNAWAAYLEVDAKRATEGIKDMESNVDSAIMAEMSIKVAQSARIESHTSDNTEDQDVSGAKHKTAEQIKAEKENAQMDDLFSEYSK